MGVGGTGLCEASSNTDDTLEKDTSKKRTETKDRLSHNQHGPRGTKEAICLQSQFTYIALQLSPLPIQGQFALGLKMTIIYLQGAHRSVDQYPMAELFSNRKIGGGKCFKPLDLPGGL